jgi:hypothetical protein
MGLIPLGSTLASSLLHGLSQFYLVWNLSLFPIASSFDSLSVQREITL